MAPPVRATATGSDNDASGEQDTQDLAGLQSPGRVESPAGRQVSPHPSSVFWPRLRPDSRPAPATNLFGPSTSQLELPSSSAEWIEQELLVEEEEEPDNDQITIPAEGPPNVSSPCSSSKCNI